MLLTSIAKMNLYRAKELIQIFIPCFVFLCDEKKIRGNFLDTIMR